MCLVPALAVFGQSRAVDPNAAAAPSPRAAIAPTESARSGANPSVEVSPLDTILMRDAKGNLVPVVGMAFEEFEQLLRLKKGLSPNAAPAYTLEAISLVGKANERTADLQLTATIRVREPGWVRVPLHLPNAVVRQSTRHEGPGEHFLTYDASAGGYVCWLNGNDARPHVVSLAIASSLTRAGEERRLSLGLPRATESSVRLVVPSATVEASLISGEGIATTQVLDETRTEIVVMGAAGDLNLAWRSRPDTSKVPTQLDASGEITVRIQSEHRITSEARLRVRSYGPPVESFRVRLPPGMEMLPAAPGGGYSLAAVDLQLPATAADSPQQPEQIVEVRLDKAASSAEIVLRAQREAEIAGSPLFFPAQFDVIGAVRQRGTIDFYMDGEWQLDWQEDRTVHRIDLMPEAAASRIVARFEYFQQPSGLGLKVSTRPARVSVEPVHQVFVEPQRVRIETILKYRFRGARAAGLRFDMVDWTFDRLTPDGLLDFPIEPEVQGGILQIPFRPGMASPAELELKLEAHRVLPHGTENLALHFPRPVADIVAPPTILVFAADNVELTPQSAQLLNLSPETMAGRPGEGRSPAFVYRDLGGDETARFVASLRILERQIAASGRASVRIDRHQVQIEQRLDYQIAHESARDFSLLVPREIASRDDLDLLLDGQSLPLRFLSDPPLTDERLERLQFTSPRDLSGNVAVTVRYSLPVTWDRKSPLAWTLPLVVPAQEDGSSFTGQQVEFQLLDDMTIEPVQNQADEVVQPTAVRGLANAYFWEDPLSFSSWLMSPGRDGSTAAVHVSQMWVQTWLSPSVRQERVVMRVRTLQESIRLRLPPGAASPVTAVDAVEVEPSMAQSVGAPGQVVTVPLKNRNGECIVEIWYVIDPPPTQLGITHSDLRPAQILESEPPRRAYWQLVMPEDQHLLEMPPEMSAEMTWSRNGLRVFRRPILDQRQLEGWLKASRQDALPSTANEYLFGSVARWPTLTFDSTNRRVLVSAASAGVLLFGLLFVNLKWLRRPSVLFVLALTLCSAALVWPEAALLVAQGSLLGLVIGGVIAGWNRIITGVATRDVRQTTTSPSKSASSPSTHSGASPLSIGSRLGTTHRTPLMEARP
jgi:hypothetical protein